MKTTRPATPVTILHRTPSGRFRGKKDLVATEEPLEIRVRGRSIAITMRTPGHDEELAAGFLVSEGVITSRSDVIALALCQRGRSPDNTLNVFLAPSVKLEVKRLSRHVFASSSCGLCGKATIEAAHQHFPPLDSPVTFSSQVLLELSGKLRAAQKTFLQTGGLHAAALFDTQGRLIVLREDIGRHNAVDKVIGHVFLKGLLPFDRHVLLVSGRASFEIMQKALAARIPLVAAISAPSSLAVEFAKESGQTLVGFLRENSYNVYTHPERLKSE